MQHKNKHQITERERSRNSSIAQDGRSWDVHMKFGRLFAE